MNHDVAKIAAAAWNLTNLLTNLLCLICRQQTLFKNFEALLAKAKLFILRSNESDWDWKDSSNILVNCFHLYARDEQKAWCLE